MKIIISLIACLFILTEALAEGKEAMFITKSLTPETALKAAQAALISCRNEGYNVTVVVVDRAGIVQVMLRDRFAGAHTPETARRKAWTAVSFRTNTTDLAKNDDVSNLQFIPNALVLGGGKFIEAGGSLVGGIGISGAPGGNLDDACADAGIDAIEEDVEF